MIIGVPVFAVFYAGIRTWINRMLKKKHLPIQTQKYMNVGLIKNQEFIAYRPKPKPRKRKKSEKGIGTGGEENSSEILEEETQDNDKFILDDDDC